MVEVRPIMVEVVAINLSPSVPNVAMVRVAMTNFSFSVSFLKFKTILLFLVAFGQPRNRRVV